MTLTTLYKKSATGALWTWRTWSNDATKYEEWGQEGGKLQRSEDTVREGKNLGKANATTPETQARAEIVSAWEHKIKAGYVESRDDALAGKTALGGYAPMLAKSVDDIHPKYLTFPCYVQPKFDGMRCQAPLDGLYSRTRKPLKFPHIEAEVARIRKEYRWLANAEFDGELYLHRFAASDHAKRIAAERAAEAGGSADPDLAYAAQLQVGFQDLMSICRKETTRNSTSSSIGSTTLSTPRATLATGTGLSLKLTTLPALSKSCLPCFVRTKSRSMLPSSSLSNKATKALCAAQIPPMSSNARLTCSRSSSSKTRSLKSSILSRDVASSPATLGRSNSRSLTALSFTPSPRSPMPCFTVYGNHRVAMSAGRLP